MKKFTLFNLATLVSIASIAQTGAGHLSINYEAANWKIWLLDNPQQITIAAPPMAVASRSELQSLKQEMGKLDEKKLAEIKYWNAGAPSYRWNQIVLGLISQKQEVLLRMPASWMNLAVYDATILAWKE